MAQDILITQNDIDKIHATEKMAKATLIIVCVATGIMLLFILVSSIHAIALQRSIKQGVVRQRGVRGGMMQPYLQPKSGTQTTPNTQTPPTQQGQTQDSTDSVDIYTL
jgi:hypothetical protein